MRLFAVWSLLGMCACERPLPTEPIEVYLAFEKAMSEGRTADAFTLLTPKSQAALKALVEHFATQKDEGPPDPFRILARNRMLRIYSPVKGVEIIAQQDDSARLRVIGGDCTGKDRGPLSEGCQSAEVALERIDGRFRIVFEVNPGEADGN